MYAMLICVPRPLASYSFIPINQRTHKKVKRPLPLIAVTSSSLHKHKYNKCRHACINAYVCVCVHVCLYVINIRVHLQIWKKKILICIFRRDAIIKMIFTNHYIRVANERYRLPVQQRIRNVANSIVIQISKALKMCACVCVRVLLMPLVAFGNIVVTLTKALTVCWPLYVVFKAISRVYGLFNLLNENARLHLTLACAAVAAVVAVAAALLTGRYCATGVRATLARCAAFLVCWLCAMHHPLAKRSLILCGCVHNKLTYFFADGY